MAFGSAISVPGPLGNAKGLGRYMYITKDEGCLYRLFTGSETVFPPRDEGNCWCPFLEFRRDCVRSTSPEDYEGIECPNTRTLGPLADSIGFRA